MESPTVVAVVYIVLGVSGLISNGMTASLLIGRRVFRLSAYSIMANIAIADAIMSVLAGIACGILLLCDPKELAITNPINSTNSLVTFPTIRSDESPLEANHFESYLNTTKNANLTVRRVMRTMMPTPEKFIRASVENYITSVQNEYNVLQLCLVFLEITAWTAGVVSYAYLGLNRCVAICFYSTRAKLFNRVSVALFASISTWVIGLLAASIGTFPDPLMGNGLDMWSISYIRKSASRPAVFVALTLFINVVSVLLQWICSTLVLLKIRQVKQKINKNKLNQNSANRFRKQYVKARLTFQFFYPSLLCTVSSILYFAKPYIREIISDHHFVILHLIWLFTHLANPFIYAYFNERMRMSYREVLTCAELRYQIRKRRKQRGFQRQNSRATMSRKSHGQRSNRMSTRSVKSQRNGNFVRSSLQMQSRDFEQLCEFMMRVNPLYDSSEGWREETTSDEEYSVRPLETRSEQANAHRESRSIVMDLGRQTVEHWVRFAKKQSI
ncbi:G-PROTEIN-RECEP-F1-2 domain-containing protein [Aphelenchoides besseyi]|nr:G-PROTEIN-RECEP-F1-2 domain-containing protein [Aphelenchoides besseyi]